MTYDVTADSYEALLSVGGPDGRYTLQTTAEAPTVQGFFSLFAPTKGQYGASRWCECFCDIRVCSLHSAHAILTINMQFHTL
jgi:hypothetical protein